MRYRNKIFYNCIAAFVVLGLMLTPIFPAAWAYEPGSGRLDATLDMSSQVAVSKERENGQNVIIGKVLENEFLQKLTESPGTRKIVISLSGTADAVRLEFTGGQAAVLAERNIEVELQAAAGSISVPAKQINLAGLAAKLNSPIAEVKLNIIIGRPLPEKVTELYKVMEKQGLPLAAQPILFQIEAQAGLEKAAVTQFDNFVTRSFKLDKPVDLNSAVAVQLLDNNKIASVPSQFTQENGSTVAVIKQKSTGIYTVTESPRNFGDIKNHWARNEVNILAAKMVISGLDDRTFAPEAKVTRAQLAAMVARAMGLDSQLTAAAFKDVRANDWYAGAIGAAVKQGIIKGYSNGTFKPKEYVTREQVAAILAQALKTSGGRSLPDAASTAEYLARFRDSKSISTWARQFVAAAVREGLINGDSTGAFAPQKNATRAEAAVMIRKMMRKAGFITPIFEVTSPFNDYVTNKDSIEIAGFTEPGSTVTVNEKPGVTAADGRFSGSAQLRQGSNSIKITLTDQCGHIMTISRTVIFDRSAPTFRVTAPEDKLITNKGLITVTGAAESGSIVTVNGLPADYGTEGNFSKVVALNAGKNEITVAARDTAGNEKVIKRTVTYDNEPPILRVVSPLDGDETGTNLMVVTGYTEPGSTVKINDQQVEPDDAGNFSKVIDLNVYSNILPITATDAAGNKSEVIRTVVFNDNRVTGLTLPEQIKIGSSAFIQYSLSVDGYVTITIYDEDGDWVRTLANTVFKTAGSHMQSWDGRDEEGDFIADASYKFVVELEDKDGEELGRAEKQQVAARVPVISGLTDSPDPVNPQAGELSSIKYKLSNDGLVTVVVYKGYTPVRNIIADMPVSDGDNSIIWDGRDDAGMVVGDGSYTYQAEAENAIDPTFRSSGKGTITVEKEAPRITDLVVTPDPFKPSDYGALNIRFNLSEAARVSVKIMDKGGKLVKTVISSASLTPGTAGLAWDGRRADGQRAANGAYKVVISAVDSFGKVAPDTVKPFTVGEAAPTPPPALPEAESYGFARMAAEQEDIVSSLTVSPNPFLIGSINGLSIKFTLSESADVTLKIIDREGRTVKTILEGYKCSKGVLYSRTWDGKGPDYKLVPEGNYSVVLSAPTSADRKLDFTAANKPVLGSVQVTRSPFKPGSSDSTSFKFNLSHNASVTVEVKNKDGGLLKTVTDKENRPAGVNEIFWDGRDAMGNVLPDGSYTFEIKAESKTVSDFFSTATGTVEVNSQLSAEPAHPNDPADPNDPFNPTGGIPATTTLTVLPDPFRIGGPNLSISYTLSQDARVTLYLTTDKDNPAETKRTILNGVLKKAGMVNMASWDGRDASGKLVTAGNYWVVLDVPATSERRQVQFHASSKPTISGLQITRSPFNPVQHEDTSYKYTLSDEARVTVQVLNGTIPVRTLMNRVLKPAGPVEDWWNGTDNAGNYVPDGTYTLEIRAESPTVSSFYSTVKGTVRVEKGVPDIIGLTLTPDPFRADKSRSLLIRYQLSESAKVSVGVYVYNTDILVRAITTDEARKAGYFSAAWDGKNTAGSLVGAGKYSVVVTAVDEYGKKGEAKAFVTFYPSFGVESSEPGKDATGVPRDARIVVNFNDFAKKGAKFDDISLKVEGRPIQYRIEFTGRTLTVTPSAEMAYGTKYLLLIPSGAVTDNAGKPMADYGLSFTTETAPRENMVEVNLSKAVISSASVVNNRTVTNIKVDQSMALDILEQNGNAGVVVIPVITDADVIRTELTGGLVKDIVYRGISLKIQSTGAALLIPPSEFNLRNMARQLNTDEGEINFYVTLSLAAPDSVIVYQNEVKKTGLVMAANPVTFEMEARGGGNTVDITRYNKRISLLIYLPSGVTQNIGGVTLKDGSRLLPVPVSFVKDSGRNAAVVKTKAAGTYGVVESKRVFRDMAGHWAKNDVALLTGRMVVAGVNADKFAPENRVTRAQFVTMIVKALGLESGSGYTRFSDIDPGAWYAGTVTAAVEAGIISGYDNGTFRPNAYIKREEAAAIICRAMELLEMKIVITGGDTQKDLDKFKDKAKVSAWARDYVGGAARSGLIRGYKDGTFAPGKNITRAEAAVLVKQVLAKAGLI